MERERGRHLFTDVLHDADMSERKYLRLPDIFRGE